MMLTRLMTVLLLLPTLFIPSLFAADGHHGPHVNPAAGQQHVYCPRIYMNNVKLNGTNQVIRPATANCEEVVSGGSLATGAHSDSTWIRAVCPDGKVMRQVLLRKVGTAGAGIYLGMVLVCCDFIARVDYSWVPANECPGP